MRYGERTRRAVFLLSATWLVTVAGAVSTPGPQQTLSFDCDSTFPDTTDAETLRRRFGAANVERTIVLIGEGFYETGTVLFAPDSMRRVEILWKDTVQQKTPRLVRVRGPRSAWRGREGLALGMHLRDIEKLNRGPFRLAGFAFDGSGFVMSWSGGRLAGPTDATCRLGGRIDSFELAVSNDIYRQVVGGREFSSGHPAMQLINPAMREMLLLYDRRSRD
jgi:hypothetical protein